MKAQDFRKLMERLATAWSTQDTELGLSCFTDDAVYMEPPDIQLYLGQEELRPYFAALTADTFMHFHQRKGPTPFSKFIERDGKVWQWHIGNYP